MKRIILMSMAAMAIATATQPRAGAQTPQQRDLKVIVRNSKGKPMKGDPVMVQVKGDGEKIVTLDRTGTGIVRVADTDTVTMFAGNQVYELAVAGFDSLQVVFRNKNRIEGMIVPAAGGTASMVNTGYSTISRRNVSSGARRVDVGSDMGATGYTTMTDYLRGRVSGVDVTRDGVISIRGGASSLNSEGPLIVVNGQTGVDINSIHPSTVISVDVLKDASSSAIYGARGANGVIVITTRKGDE